MAEGAKTGRREFVAALASGGLTPLVTSSVPSQARSEDAPPASGGSVADPSALLVLTATEAAFVSACVDAFVPDDPLTPAGTQCGVVSYIDRQLAGSWGAGAGLYRSGPFMAGKPEYGYQLPLTPLEYVRAGIAAANRWCSAEFGRPLDQLQASQVVQALRLMESGNAAFVGFDSKGFFEQILQLTYEAMFADPMYGGNRGKVGWRLLGYPGLPALYAESVRTHAGKRLELPPRSIGDFS